MFILMLLASAITLYAITIACSVIHGRDWATKNLITVLHFCVTWHALALLFSNIYVVTISAAISVAVWWLKARSGKLARAELDIMDGDTSQHAFTKVNNLHKVYSPIAYLISPNLASRICFYFAVPGTYRFTEEKREAIRGKARMKTEATIAARLICSAFRAILIFILFTGGFMFKFSKHSLAQRETLHPDLILICDTAIKFHDFRIQEGHRSKEAQNEAFKMRRSKLKWPQSKHNSMPSEAMDLLPFVNGRFIGWDAWPQWRYFGGVIMGVSDLLYDQGKISAPLRWGHDWDGDNDLMDTRFVDAPHFERGVK